MFNFNEKLVHNTFKIALKTYGMAVEKLVPEKKIFGNKKIRRHFLLFINKLPTVQIWGQMNKILRLIAFKRGPIPRLAFRGRKKFKNSFYFQILGIVW